MVDYEAFEKLTRKLVNFDNLMIHEGKECMTIKMINGECKGWSLFDLGGAISVVKFFAKKGSEFYTHTHTQKEWIIVYEGEMLVTYDSNKMKKLGNGDGVYITENTPHTASCPEDTWFIIVTIPNLNKE